MRWHKLGQIFDTADHALPLGCVAFAQSPQSLVFKDFVRVYFSTRQLDSKGKYLSHVAYVDFDKNFSRVIRVSTEPVIPLGGLGAFDEHGIFPFNVVRNGAQIYAYSTGWNRRVSVSTDAAIGLAISHDDGRTFEKFGQGPVLGPALHEPFLVGDAFVRQYRRDFHMWYIFGTRWTVGPAGGPPERVYKIAHATSKDGKDWTRNGRAIITNRLNEDECQALPTVVEIDEIFHMFFCYRESTDFRNDPDRTYKIGHAISSDLINWQRDDDFAPLDIPEKGWDSQMQCYPHVFEMDGGIYLLYNGNEFGRFGFGLAKLEY